MKDGDQGAPYIRSVLLEKYPNIIIPHERTIQRLLKKGGTNRPVGRPKKKSVQWTIQPNHTWQIDGKGKIQLATGQQISWMNIADEATSSDLLTRLCPQNVVESIPPQKACQIVNECMSIWGCPKQIKIDNGLPFAKPRNRDLPTLSQLWWIGLGIDVQLNNPGCPQENGTVEGLQGICHRWSVSKLHNSLEGYQKRVDETNRIQREVYRIRKQGDKTRQQLYPELWENKRTYDPNNFDIKKVYQNLSNRVWQRTVTKGASISFWLGEIYVGTPFIHQKVTVTFDPIDIQWVIRAINGTLLKTSKKEFFTEAQILEYAGISKN